MTYFELLAMIPIEPSDKVPTDKYLRENDTPLVVSDDGSAVCYASGFVSYRSTVGTTVFSIFDCRTYT